MNDWLKFRSMWTPAIVEMIFLTGSILIVGIGLFYAVEGESTEARWGSLVVAILGPLLLRLYCEALVLPFKIHEAVELILDELSVPDDGGPESTERARRD